MSTKEQKIANEFSFKNLLLLSTPMIFTSIVMFYIIINDYIINNYSFTAKSRLYSQIPFSEIDVYSQVKCSNDYDKNCIPNQCGRYATDFLVTDDEVNILLKIAKEVNNKGSADFDISNFVSKSNEFNDVKNRLINTINRIFKIDNLNPTGSIIFNELKSNSNGQYLNNIYDKFNYNYYDLTAIIYLNSHNIDFYGGVMIFNDTKSTLSFEPKAGRVIMYTSGSENLHSLSNIEWGTRYELRIPFTCNKKL